MTPGEVADVAARKRSKSRARAGVRPAPAVRGREREAVVPADAQPVEDNAAASPAAPVFEFDDTPRTPAPEGAVDDWADTDTAAGMADEPTAGRRRR